MDRRQATGVVSADLARPIVLSPHDSQPGGRARHHPGCDGRAILLIEDARGDEDPAPAVAFFLP